MIDCFAGAGGLSAGLREAGFIARAAFDNDMNAVETYRRNVGPHILLRNAADITAAELITAAGCEVGECALVAGGPQPVPGRVLDELEASGMLDLSGDVPRVTEQGAYRFKKWGEKWHKRFRERR